tara:strand:+ start:882 stop:1340 length:459 start_codon:yes stop_codon:yes gene_type:complete
MEFITYLDKIEIEIISIVKKAGYSIEENTPLCLLGKDYVGFLKKRQKTIVICTDNAKNREGYKYLNRKNDDIKRRIGLHLKKAIRHESVHVAQSCNKGNILNKKKYLSMNPTKENALKGSMKISSNKNKEIEAYVLEDKPKLIKEELKKYCL